MVIVLLAILYSSSTCSSVNGPRFARGLRAFSLYLNRRASTADVDGKSHRSKKEAKETNKVFGERVEADSDRIPRSRARLAQIIRRRCSMGGRRRLRRAATAFLEALQPRLVCQTPSRKVMQRIFRVFAKHPSGACAP